MRNGAKLLVAAAVGAMVGAALFGTLRPAEAARPDMVRLHPAACKQMLGIFDGKQDEIEVSVQVAKREVIDTLMQINDLYAVATARRAKPPREQLGPLLAKYAEVQEHLALFSSVGTLYGWFCTDMAAMAVPSASH